MLAVTPFPGELLTPGTEPDFIAGEIHSREYAGVEAQFDDDFDEFDHGFSFRYAMALVSLCGLS